MHQPKLGSRAGKAFYYTVKAQLRPSNTRASISVWEKRFPREKYKPVYP